MRLHRNAKTTPTSRLLMVHWSSQDSVDTLGQRFLSRFELLGAHPA